MEHARDANSVWMHFDYCRAIVRAGALPSRSPATGKSSSRFYAKPDLFHAGNHRQADAADLER